MLVRAVVYHVDCPAPTAMADLGRRYLEKYLGECMLSDAFVNETLPQNWPIAGRKTPPTEHCHHPQLNMIALSSTMHAPYLATVCRRCNRYHLYTHPDQRQLRLVATPAF